MILAGDIGGTKTVLRLLQRGEEGLESVHEKRYASREAATFEDILGPFVKEAGEPTLLAACFAVAGPVSDGSCHTTNLPWVLREGELARVLRAPRVKLLNDLEGTAYGMIHLPKEDLKPLNPGLKKGRRGNIAVIAAGTGWGEA